MKKLILFSFSLCLLFACSEQESSRADEKAMTVPVTTNVWKGTIRGDIPVNVYYQREDNLRMGAITYMNTVSKTPIKLVGGVEKETDIRLYEFDALGNITGIITGSVKRDSIKGDWFSPKTRDRYPLVLAKSAEKIKPLDLKVSRDDLFGHYRYQFGIKGYEGDFDIAKVDEERVAFALSAVTEHPGRNIASIERDTVKMEGTSFEYIIPGTKDCGVKFSFYKDVLNVEYTNGYCDGVFGHNASVDGEFYKVK